MEAAVTFVPRGRLLAEVPGFRSGPGSRVLSRIGEVPIAALFEAVAGGPGCDAILASAARHPQLYPLSPAVVERALGELLQLDFLREAK